MIFFYRIFINLVFLLLPLIILIRLIKKKEDAKRFKEKIGFFKKNNTKGQLIWFHGASIGEIQSIVPILEKFEKSKEIKKILVTSNTLSSSKIFFKTKYKKVTHQFFPIDNNYITKKFIKNWSPTVAIFIDSEIWPNMLTNLEKNKIPIVLINARITNKSFKRWLKIKNFSKTIFSKFYISLCSNKETMKYLKKLGAINMKYFGNLKYAQSENKKIDIDTQALKFISKRTTWCASNTHETEEKFVGLIHVILKKKFQNLLTVVIPRHIDRKEQIKKQLTDLGLKVHLHYPKTKIRKNTDIYLVNSFGKTKSFYSIIKNVFLGGSIINHGGQNPLEAVRYNCNILHGPNVSNFNEIYKFLNEQKVSKKILNVSQASSELKKLLSLKKTNNDIKKKINLIGQKILKQNIYEIKKVLKRI